MAVPDEIANSSLLVSAKIRAWTDWFKAGRAVKRDTLANLRTAAAAEPTYAFMCFATDTLTAYMYVGDVTVADGGFITLGGGIW